MSGYARQGRRSGRFSIAPVVAFVVAGGAAFLIGKCRHQTEGTAHASETATASASDDRAAAVTIEAVSSTSLAGSPVLLRLKGVDARGKPSAGLLLPRDVSLVVDAIEPSARVTVSGGFSFKSGRVEPDATTRFDADGQMFLAIAPSPAPEASRVHLIVGEREILSVPVSWEREPDSYFVCLPGQKLEGAIVVGAPEPAIAGQEIEVVVVPFRAGQETTFFGSLQATATIEGAASCTFHLEGARALVRVSVPKVATESASVEIMGLSGTRKLRSATFRVAPLPAPRNG